MCKIKSRLCRISALVLALAVAAGTVAYAKREKIKFTLPDTTTAETGTNRFTMYSQLKATSSLGLNLEGFYKAIESSSAELWISDDNSCLRLRDKKSGYVWGGPSTGFNNDLNDMWNAMANSIFTLFYFDENNNENQKSLSDMDVDKTCDIKDGKVIISANFSSVGIKLAISLELSDERLEVSVVKNSLKESGDCKVSKLYILPFFGSTLKGETDGYFFVPDGSGALLRFDPNTNYETPYEIKIYGADAGVDAVDNVTDLLAKRPNDYLTEENKALVPVYGVVHGAEQYAFLSVITGGDEYASVSASLAGEIIPYNWITSCFEYRKMYNKPVSKSNSIHQPQEKANDLTPSVAFYFLSGNDADYNGMALKYRSVLEKDGEIKRLSDEKSDISIRVNVVGSDVKKGFLFNSMQTLTTLDEAEEIYESLNKNGINNLSFVISGWQKGGLNGNKYGSFKTQGSVGSFAQLKKLRDTVEKQGNRFYLQFDPSHINETQGKISYLANTGISKELSHYYRDNTSVMFPRTYVVSPRLAADNMTEAGNKLENFNLSIDSIGSELSSDYSQKRSITRSESIELLVKTLSGLSEKSGVAVETPSIYFWKYCDEIYNVPMMNSQFTMQTDSVPFLQIVLKGYVKYYAPYANKGFYRTNSILRTIEYGAYPSFIVMNEQNSKLTNTPLVDSFSLNYGDWESTIASTYQKVNSALSAVIGSSITEHKVLQSGVVRVTYDNNCAIYINYNSDDIETDGITVKGSDFVLKRG